VGSEGLFDDMGGRFTARLRHHQTLTHTSPGGGRGESISVRSRLGVLEARFDLEVLDRLHEPCFVAIERVLGGIHTRGGGDAGKAYLVYEVTGVSPTHYQMLAMNTALPTVIRKEYLNTIYEGWGVSDETWVDVHCAPTGYMVVEDGGRPVFTRSSLVPLAGAPAHLLSREATRSFLCVEGGVPIGTILGFDIELTVDIHSLVKYHAGVFGFTGTGKSNLTSLIVRQSLDAWGGDGTVVVFDVAGEYAVNLADMLATGGILYSPEELGDVDSLLESQTLPETLESKISAEQLRAWAGGLVDDGRVRPLQLGDEGVGVSPSASYSTHSGGTRMIGRLGRFRRLSSLSVYGSSPRRGAWSSMYPWSLCPLRLGGSSRRPYPKHWEASTIGPHSTLTSQRC